MSLADLKFRLDLWLDQWLTPERRDRIEIRAAVLYGLVLPLVVLAVVVIALVLR